MDHGASWVVTLSLCKIGTYVYSLSPRSIRWTGNESRRSGRQETSIRPVDDWSHKRHTGSIELKEKEGQVFFPVIPTPWQPQAGYNMHIRTTITAQTAYCTNT